MFSLRLAVTQQKLLNHSNSAQSAYCSYYTVLPKKKFKPSVMITLSTLKCSSQIKQNKLAPVEKKMSSFFFSLFFPSPPTPCYQVVTSFLGRKNIFSVKYSEFEQPKSSKADWKPQSVAGKRIRISS